MTTLEIQHLAPIVSAAAFGFIAGVVAVVLMLAFMASKDDGA